MASGAFIFVLVGIGGLAVGIGVLGYLQAKRRREELAAYAASRGWRYEPDAPELVDRFEGAPFGVGHGRRAENAVQGTHEGRDFVAFDYSYVTTSGSGKDRHDTTHRFSVVALSMGAHLPSLSVDPENFVERFVGRLTNSDIELESDDFNRAFTVTCPDRKFASDVLHPAMMEFLLQHRELGWRFDGDQMLLVHIGQRATSEIEPALRLMEQITGLVPEFVWLRLKGQG